MKPERWKQVEAVFEHAIELPNEARPDFLRRTCDCDDELRREVESLLESHARAGEFIDGRNRFFRNEMLEEIGGTAATGQTIGPYRVVRELGRGGMGAVYLAERADQQYHKQVAIKLIKRGMDTDSVLRHFRNERQILAGFDHPNIARLFDGGTTHGGLPYFVMEYVEGIPIDQYCDQRGLRLKERLQLFLQVCAAVTYAHRHTVVHRDLKPSNIVITNEGLPKLLDFGIAKMLQADGGAPSLMTAPGVRAMTPEYASPEQVRGKAVTTASDVYSLGVVLYQLLTGNSPYRLTKHTAQEVEQAITDQAPARPSAVSTDKSRLSKIEFRKLLKGDLDNVLLMALRKEPSRRYQSVEQLSEDILRHLEARPVLARKDSFRYRTAKFIQRNRVATTAALLVFLSLIAGMLATSWQAHRARVEKARAERRFNDVRQLAHSVLFDYHDAIKDLPGATKVRERLVKDALTYLDSLAGEAQGDSALQRELAAAYERVGDVRGAAYGPSLGDRAGANESYDKALRIRQAVAKSAPADRQRRWELATIYAKLGAQLNDTSELARGLVMLRQSLALFRSLASEDPANRELRHGLAAAYTAVGLALLNTGDMGAVLEMNRQSIPLFEGLLREDAQDRAARRGLSVAYERIGSALFLSNDVQGALAHNERALLLREALLAEDPSSADYRRIVAISYQNNGDYRAWVKDFRGALASFRKKQQIDEASFAADPANAQARGDLAYCRTRLGDLLQELGEDNEAVLHYERAIELFAAMAQADSQDEAVRLRLSIAHGQLGKTQARSGRIAEGRKECADAAELLRTTPNSATNIDWRRLEGLAYTQLGDAYLALAQSDKTNAVSERRNAREMYQRGLVLMRDLQKRGILDEDEAKEINTVAGKIAECDKMLPP